MKLGMMPLLLGAMIFCVGLSAASITPYRAVVAIDELGFDNGTFAAILIFNAIATAVGSVVLGHLSDRLGDRRRVVVFTAVLGLIAYGLVYALPSKVTYLLAFCVILPLGGALMSQTLAFSRAYLDQTVPDRVVSLMSNLRSLFSVAWVVVPPLAGWIAARTDVYQVFGIAALGNLAFLLVFVVMFTRPEAELPAPAAGTGGSWAFWRLLPRPRAVGICGVMLLRSAIMLHLTVLPLAMITNFGGTLGDVGITAGVAAALEVPIMIAWGYGARRWRMETILILNGLLFGAYLAGVSTSQTPMAVLLWQIPNAVATAALISMTINYLQESIKGQVGLSTSLIDVVQVAAMMIAGGCFHLLSTEIDYRMVFVGGTAMCGLGVALLWVSRGMKDTTA